MRYRDDICVLNVTSKTSSGPINNSIVAIQGINVKYSYFQLLLCRYYEVIFGLKLRFNNSRYTRDKMHIQYIIGSHNHFPAKMLLNEQGKIVCSKIISPANYAIGSSCIFPISKDMI